MIHSHHPPDGQLPDRRQSGFSDGTGGDSEALYCTCLIPLQDPELGAASQVVPIIETKRRDWWPAAAAVLVMASVFVFVGVSTQSYEAVVLGGLFFLIAIALVRFDYQIYLDGELWSCHKRISTWGLTLKRLDRDLSLYDRNGECPIKFDRESRQLRGYRLGLIASNQSTIWIDFKGYQDQFQKARAACTGAWRGRVSTLDE
ncbi:MAG: hypothetical protein ACNA8P_10410 [Phycisphaerales bacterium]